MNIKANIYQDIPNYYQENKHIYISIVRQQSVTQQKMYVVYKYTYIYYDQLLTCTSIYVFKMYYQFPPPLEFSPFQMINFCSSLILPIYGILRISLILRYPEGTFKEASCAFSRMLLFHGPSSQASSFQAGKNILLLEFQQLFSVIIFPAIA